MIIVREKWDSKTFKDAWGFPTEAYIVVDEVVVEKTEETHKYNNGYEYTTGSVWVAPDGQKCYSYAPIDYGSSGSYFWLEPGERTGFYCTPSKHRRYLRNGNPSIWDGKKWIRYNA